MSAYSEGFEGFIQGKSNPYLVGDKRCAEWCKGYAAAKKCAKKARKVK